MKHIALFSLLILLGAGCAGVPDPEGAARDDYQTDGPAVASFEDCVAAGNPVMESYPRQCRHNGELFVEDVELDLDIKPVSSSNQSVYYNTSMDEIIVDMPIGGMDIEDVVMVKGQARGTWFFEATAPITLTNWDGLVIAEGFVTAEGDWMTEEFVPFAGELTFTAPAGDTGFLILSAANPSGLAENERSVEVPIVFE